MPLICYEPKDFSAEKIDLIAKANLLVNEYHKGGYSLTLRQLYYRLFALGHIKANNLKEYSRLGDLISDGRMAGLIDWDAIVDRTRASISNTHWNRPSEVIESALSSYAINKWENQAHYVEVWVEKEALEDVLAKACGPLDVRYFACKGYTSQSAMWEAAQRLLAKKDEGKEVHIIHLGDHDPSGIDMSRDIYSRLSTFTYSKVHVQRIALNMSQVEKYNPPPNPAKVTDSRFAAYSAEYGDESWELDALEPAALVDLIKRAILQYRDDAGWGEAVKIEKRGRHLIECILKYFPDVIGFLRERRKRDDSEVICAECGATRAKPECLCDGKKGTILL